MSNGAFSAAADLLEKQTARLAHQARVREGARTTAVEMARRAQVAQAEARQAATLNAAAASGEHDGGDGGGPGGEKKRAAATTAAVMTLEAAVVANQASEAAAAEARTLATAKGEVWLGAEALATLLAGLVECRLVDGASWTGGGAAGAGPGAGVVGAGMHQGGGGGGASSSSTPSKVAHRACKAIMKQVGVLSEEELKKENQDVRIYIYVCVYHVVWLACVDFCSLCVCLLCVCLFCVFLCCARRFWFVVWGMMA